MTIVLMSFLATYFALQRYVFTKSEALINSVELSPKNSKTIFYILLGFSISFPIIHLYLLGHFPFFTSWQIFDYKKIFHIRNDIVTQSSNVINYLSSFVVKAFLPIVIFFSLKHKFIILHIALVLVGSFYCLNLMQKGYILLVLAPVILYSILNLQFKQFAVYLIIIVGVIVLQVYAANPELRTQNKAQIVYSTEAQQVASEPTEPRKSTLYYVAKGLANRICYIPGKIVCEWFSYIPSKLPFQNGDGYLFLCRINKHKFVDYSLLLYDIVYPEYGKVGIHGTVNGAFFIYDYANFGKVGLLISGVLIALLLFILSLVHTINPKQSVSLISYYIFMLSSSALSTLLFSGGFGFVILFFLLFNKLEK